LIAAPSRVTEEIDVAIVGAGAAGLMTAIWAARAAPGHRVVCLDGAARLGAKILIAGGGRCNVTHDVVCERAFAGASPNAIRKVLRRFDVPETVAFFAELGVTLVREETGKLFPTTDRARTVLDALVGAARTAGAELRHPWRVETITPSADGLVVAGPAGALVAPHVVLASGGRSVPKTGSDGHGYALARALGHTVTSTFPALVPLTLPEGHALRALRGVAVDVALVLRTSTGKRLLALGGSLLCTHTGLSGPVVLDMSRHWHAAFVADPSVELAVDWVPALGRDGLDALLLAPGSAGPVRRLHAHLPERLARALCEQAGVDGSAPALGLTRAVRRTLVETVTAFVLPVTGDRGFDHAEVTAGGVPLTEIRLETMASRVRPGLHLVGEICDVDGRIGGYNFQWAWASGYVAGNAIGTTLAG
jgi:predicted Rossmann fold flavoprotein